MGSVFGLQPARGGEKGLAGGTWMPAVDIIEDEKEFLVKAELPEIKRDDVHVSVENGVLTIRGERKLEKEEKNKRYHRTERSYGSFTRSFSLPEGADSNNVRADFKDDLLQVHLPKSNKGKPNHFEVKVE